MRNKKTIGIVEVGRLFLHFKRPWSVKKVTFFMESEMYDQSEMLTNCSHATRNVDAAAPGRERDFLCGIKMIIIPSNVRSLRVETAIVGNWKIRRHIRQIEPVVGSGLLFDNSTPFLSVIEFRHQLPESIHGVQR